MVIPSNAWFTMANPVNMIEKGYPNFRKPPCIRWVWSTRAFFHLRKHFLKRVADDDFSDRCWCRLFTATIERNSSCRNSCVCAAKGKIRWSAKQNLLSQQTGSNRAHLVRFGRQFSKKKSWPSDGFRPKISTSQDLLDLKRPCKKA